jgi:hypothetical protein
MFGRIGHREDNQSFPSFPTYQEWYSEGGSMGAKFILAKNPRKCDRIRTKM